MTQERITLYRAVTEIELADIRDKEAYVVGPASDGKYFYPTPEQAKAFVAKGWAVAVTSSAFTSEELIEAEEDTAAGEGGYLYLPRHLFPHGPVTVEETP